VSPNGLGAKVKRGFRGSDTGNAKSGLETKFRKSRAKRICGKRLVQIFSGKSNAAYVTTTRLSGNQKKVAGGTSNVQGGEKKGEGNPSETCFDGPSRTRRKRKTSLEWVKQQPAARVANEKLRRYHERVDHEKEKTQEI